MEVGCVGGILETHQGPYDFTFLALEPGPPQLPRNASHSFTEVSCKAAHPAPARGQKSGAVISSNRP